MGQSPAKMFGPPVPYGSSPDSNVLMQAIAPLPAPQQTFLPLNPQDQQPKQASTQPAQVGRLGGLPGLGVNRIRPQLNRGGFGSLYE